MSIAQRIESLKTKHADIDKQLDQEAARPHPDESTLHSLKKQKLHIKDELQSLSAQS